MLSNTNSDVEKAHKDLNKSKLTEEADRKSRFKEQKNAEELRENRQSQQEEHSKAKYKSTVMKMREQGVVAQVTQPVVEDSSGMVGDGEGGQINSNGGHQTITEI